MNYLRKLVSILEYKERKKIIILSFLFLISTLFEIFSLGMIFPLIKSLLDPDSVSFFLKENFELFIDTENLRILMIVSFFLIFLFKNIFLFFFNWWTFKVTQNLNVRLCKDLFSGYLNMDPIFFMQRNTGLLLRNLQIEAGLVSKSIYQIITLINEMLVIFSISFLLIFFDWKSFLFVTLLLIFFFSIFSILSKNYILKLGKKRTKISGKIPKLLIEGFNSYKEIQIYNSKNFFINRYVKEENKVASYNIISQIIAVVPKLYFELIFIFIFSIFTYYFLIFNPSLSKEGTNLVTVLGMFGAAAIRILPSCARILSSLQGIRYQKKSLEIIYDEINEIKNLNLIKNQVITKNKINFSESINFKDVNFSYGEKKVLINFNLKIKKGEKIGIIGSNGKGKSTLLNIFLGFLKPNSGIILVDDNDIHQDVFAWRENIGYVPQNINLMNMSIKDNILFGREESKQIDSKLLNISCLTKFIESYNEGINTEVSELGKNISGGQAQKIAIARSLYLNPKILILDESTSSIDNEDEKEIIENLIRDKDLTIIFVTHKKNVLDKFDRIIELK